MNIAYFINVYPRPSQTFIWREIAALEAQGIVVHRFALRPDREFSDAAERNRTRYVLTEGILTLVSASIATLLARPLSAAKAMAIAWQCGLKSDRGILRHLAYWAEACVLRRWLAHCKAEHVHGHFGTNSTTILMLSRILGGPSYSFTAHGPEEFDNPVGLSLRDKIHHAEFVVAVCEFGRSQLFRWCSHDQWHKLHVVRCGIDANFLDAPPTPVPAAPRLLSVGRLTEQKGQLLLVEAAVILARRGFDFEITLVGDGEMGPEIRRLVNRENLETQVKMVGWKTNLEIRNLMLASRALVMPSFAEGLPVVIMESLALQRPVLSTYLAGIPELVVNDVSGFLVPAGSVDALVAGIIDLLRSEPADLWRLGTAGAERVRTQHDVFVEAAKLAKLFAQCAAPESLKLLEDGKHDLPRASVAGELQRAKASANSADPHFLTV